MSDYLNPRADLNDNVREKDFSLPGVETRSFG
jgi:hypothetical protein